MRSLRSVVSAAVATDLESIRRAGAATIEDRNRRTVGVRFVPAAFGVVARALAEVTTRFLAFTA